jgi:energy-coupling factor transporter ATP-binding protein EcfA2
MKIRRIRIERFRSFRDETIEINRYACLVGPNGAGKSNVLAALNVFFREQAASATDVTKLVEEDWFNRDTSQPIRITVTFDDLDERAQEELKDYYRQGELVVTASAEFDSETGSGIVQHAGQRFGMDEFRSFFEGDKRGMKAGDLAVIYDGFRSRFSELPNPKSKDDKAAALRKFESAHPERCVLMPSEDNFYGVNSTGKLAKFVQWVCVPAVKDAGEESQEAKNTALGKLIGRAVRTRVSFDQAISVLRTETLTKYQELLDVHQEALAEISTSLQKRLADWAHPDVHLGVEWLSDPAKSVQLQQPVAGIRTGEGDFLGSLARMGHGLQRSYLLALLQELAGSDVEDAPTLILACEEPELYQHPPQARHLADVLRDLATGNNQVLVTTHSPLFVSGDGFENVRLVRRARPPSGSRCKGLRFNDLSDRIRKARGSEASEPRIPGLVAKIHQALQPHIAEMFFARLPVLVEGLEDVAYITTQLHLSGRWDDFRRLGCHLIPVGGKGRVIQPLAIARELQLSVYTLFDSDGDTQKPEHRTRHENDNKALLALLNVDSPPFPANTLVGDGYTVWRTDITRTVREDLAPRYAEFAESASVHFAKEGGLEKNSLFIADWLSAAHDAGCVSPSLVALCESILTFASKEHSS